MQRTRACQACGAVVVIQVSQGDGEPFEGIDNEQAHAAWRARLEAFVDGTTPVSRTELLPRNQPGHPEFGQRTAELREAGFGFEAGARDEAAARGRW
jgi:hypothetical protein